MDIIKFFRRKFRYIRMEYIVYRKGNTYRNITGYCICGIIVSSKHIKMIKELKLIPVIKYYLSCIKSIINNKINCYKLNKREIVFE